MSVRESLDVFHETLERHFNELRRDRDIRRPGLPIFALEHGLGDGDLTVLTATVTEAVRQKVHPGKSWLPYVIHATEVGYRYTGKEYWPTLEDQTPGWEAHVGREFVKYQFRAFAKKFGGAEPKGKWASHFTTICWPITHAILPSDLQLQLARMLFDYRGSLTYEQFENSGELGQALASHSYQYSKRFQQFSANTELLGYVSAVLLSESHAIDTLLPSTLERIISDFPREAGRLLKSARASADKVNKSGMAGMSRGGSAPTNHANGMHSRETPPPIFFAEYGINGWGVSFRVPDFSPLLARFPELREELAVARCFVRGGSPRPRARGWLLYSGQRVSLEEWPGVDEPLFSLEDSSVLTSERVALESRTPNLDQWLFRLGADGTGRLVKSGLIQSSTRYLIIRGHNEYPAASWIANAPVDLRGASAVIIQTPEVLTEDAASIVAKLGFGIQTNVNIVPIGLVPALWDGSGYAEWIVGDSPILMLSSSHDIRTCCVMLEGANPLFIDWNVKNPHPIIQLPELPVGLHRLRISFAVGEGAQAVSDGYVDCRIREAEVSRVSGTFRDPLQIRVLPPSASIEDVWDGQAALDVNGPIGSRCKAVVMLLATDETNLATTRFRIQLPMPSSEWPAFHDRHMRRSAKLADAYDEAAQLVVEISDLELGSAEIRFEREEYPLRWAFKEIHGKPELRLFESGDTGVRTEVRYASFEHPTEFAEVTTIGPSFANNEGGLFIAKVGSISSGAILPREVLGLKDLMPPPPRIAVPMRGAKEVAASIELAQAWARARSPGHLIVEMSRQSVLTAFSAAVASSIGGRKWISLEEARSRGSRLSLVQLEGGLAKPGSWRSFREGVRKLAESSRNEPPVWQFAALLSQVVGDFDANTSEDKRTEATLNDAQRELRFPELLLRLASQPWTLNLGEGGLSEVMSKVIEYPMAFRAARMLHISAFQNDCAWQWN